MLKIYGINKKFKDDIIYNGVFCPIPWIHFVTYPDGTAQICTHQSDTSVSLGNAFINNFKDIINHENIKKLRINMMSGITNSLCSNCNAFDKANKNSSSRTHYISKFNHLLSDCLLNTNDDGYLNPEFFRFAYWNFKISGVCNLKCRTCHPHFSTSIYNECKKYGWLDKKNILDFEKIRENLKLLMAEILKYIDCVEEIHFVGGEPMLMNEHWQILEEIIVHKRFDLRLSYHTNLTKLTYKHKHVFDFWKKITGKIWLSPSIDAFDTKNEYIRDGLVWETFNTNLTHVLNLSNALKNICVVPTITVSVFNVLYLDELIDYLCFKKVDQLNFNIVRYPGYYHACLLPEKLKNTAKNKLDKCIERNHLDCKIFNIIKSEIDNNYTFDVRESLLKNFKTETLKLDAVRGKKFEIVFPELTEMLN